ncbi:MAG: hypothetical protein P8X54_08830 [Desulfuromonadales bacterium]
MENFIIAARNVGADVQLISNLEELVAYIDERIEGGLLLSPCPSLKRAGLSAMLKTAGVDVVEEEFRAHGASAAAGLTGANFDRDEGRENP